MKRKRVKNCIAFFVLSNRATIQKAQVSEFVKHLFRDTYGLGNVGELRIFTS
jgi:hypothetical protein